VTTHPEIKLSSGYHDCVVDRSSAHMRLMVLLHDAGFSLPTASGKKSRIEYADEVICGVNLVPGEVLDVVITEFLSDYRRRYLPSLAYLQTACREAMQAMEDLSRL